MKFILLLSLFGAFAYAQETSPFDFDYTQLKSIGEAPQFAHMRSRTLGNGPRAGRIVGGQISAAGQLPHHVILIVGDREYWCGGSMIYENWVLTVSYFNLVRINP